MNTQRVLAAVQTVQEALQGPAMGQLRKASQELAEARQRLNETLVRTETTLLRRYPDRQASMVLEPGTKLHFNDQGLSVETYDERSGHYDVQPLRHTSQRLRLLALRGLEKMMEEQPNW